VITLKIVSFFNVKGGVGKTTLTILTAIKLSKKGKKIFIIALLTVVFLA